ncbi:hypothetical protein ACSSS7_007909 [Eimeria intestinalis]
MVKPETVESVRLLAEPAWALAGSGWLWRAAGPTEAGRLRAKNVRRRGVEPGGARQVVAEVVAATIAVSCDVVEAGAGDEVLAAAGRGRAQAPEGRVALAFIGVCGTRGVPVRRIAAEKPGTYRRRLRPRWWRRGLLGGGAQKRAHGLPLLLDVSASGAGGAEAAVWALRWRAQVSSPVELAGRAHPTRVEVIIDGGRMGYLRLGAPGNGGGYLRQVVLWLDRRHMDGDIVERVQLVHGDVERVRGAVGGLQRKLDGLEKGVAICVLGRNSVEAGEAVKDFAAPF